jgi:hypothetical protein
MSELQLLLDELADAGEARGAGAVFGVATQNAVTRRRIKRRRRAASAIAAGVVLVLAVGAIVQAGHTHRDPAIRIGNGSGEPTPNAGTAASLAAGSWRVVPAAPVQARDGAAVAWTGKELFVWGGEGKNVGKSKPPMFDDGAAYDPQTRTWRVLAPAPLGGRVYAAAVWTGSEVVVWGGSFGDVTVSDAAAYNPATDTWRTLPPAPIAVANYADGSAVWTGDRVVVFAGASAAAYDPKANRWRALPPEPVHQPVSRRFAVAAGPGRILVWSVWELDKPTGPSTFAGTGGSDLLRYDEQTNSWTALTPGRDAIVQPEEAFWTGDRILVRGDMHQPGALGPGPLPEVSAWYDPETGHATRLPADAMDAGSGTAGNFSSAWTGRALMSWEVDGQSGPIKPGDGSVYDAQTNTWRRLRSAPFGCASGPTDLVWTGATMITYCSEPYPAQANPIGGLELAPGPPDAATVRSRLPRH